ncbi:MAG: rhodanese-like domain-containing protein [Verrucomicrobiota bacterium]|jgi:rhodanese-related sulfurtransferase
MVHSPGFLNLVNDAKKRVKEISVAEARARLAANPKIVLLDVREDNEWQAGHAAEAMYLGKGILERDLEKTFPDPKTEIIMYCGGGFRSVLSCDAAQMMGYRNVCSLIGGYKGMLAANWPMKSGDAQ